MAKHLDKFTRPFQNSTIPFALAEVLTNGRGEMVDVVCRFLNPAAAELLQIPAKEVQGRRLSQLGLTASLEVLSPLQTVAFSGSSASFPCETAGGQALSVTCYQVMYGVVGCLLDPGGKAPGGGPPLPETVPAAVLELGRGGLRCSACNRGFCRLTGHSQKTLLRQGADTFSALVLPEDWPALLQSLLDAAREGRNGDQDFRLLQGDGSAVWVNLQAELLSSRQGTAVFRGLFTDVDRLRRQEAAADREYHIRAQLCDLLLEHTSLLTLDYDPRADLAQIQRYSPGGRRTSRTISGYLKSLSTAPALHPEDRRRLASAIRRALTRPGTISCSYRADYEGTGWRQYQVSWMSLFDEHGDVCRLLGKAEDVTSRQAAAEHFRQLAARHRRQAKSVLASARLDLTANQTLDAKAASRYLLRTLFDRTADACLRRMAAAVPESEAQRQFAALFSPEALGAAFAAGSFQFSLDHPVAAGKSGTLRARTVAEIVENPDTLHLEVFFQLQDRRERDLQAALLEGLIQRPGTAVLTADAATGRCRGWGPAAERLREGTTCRSLAAWYFRQLPPSRERAALRRAVSLEAMLARLETAPAVELTLPAPDGSALRLRCARLEGLADMLLITCQQSPSAASLQG